MTETKFEYANGFSNGQANGGFKLEPEGTLRDGLYIKGIPSCYSAAQLSEYLTRIRFSPKEHAVEQSIADGHFPATLDNLERLMRLHLLTFPFENTPMHYTLDHVVDVDPKKLYHRFMDEKKGSCCLGQNLLFLHMLRGLGYRAYNLAARVNVYSAPDPKEYSAPTHLLILVQPVPDSNITYLVDVGFGTGPVRPILLTESEKSVVTGTTVTETFRIKKGVIPKSSLESRHGSGNRHWILEVQRVNDHNPEPSTAPWIPVYAFLEEEFHQPEIANASFCISHPSYVDGALFRHHVIAIKYVIIDEEGKPILEDEKIADELADASKDLLDRDMGRMVLIGKELKLTYGRKSEVVKQLQSEVERVGVLRDMFGIGIEDDEMHCIQGLPSALSVDSDQVSLW